MAKADVSLQNLEFHLLTRSLRSFLYSSLCDIYVEAVKKVLSDPHHPQFEATLQTIYLALITGLRLMHPVMPFITEELYQRLKNFGNGSGSSDSGKITSIMVEPFPIANEVSEVLFLFRARPNQASESFRKQCLLHGKWKLYLLVFLDMQIEICILGTYLYP